MEEKFYHDDFEKFLQDQVQHHKMFPSDRIWRNILSKIHQDYKWPALTIAGLAFLAATIAVSVYFSPGPNIFAVDNPSRQFKRENAAGSTSPIFKTTYKSQKPVFDNSVARDLTDIVADEIFLDNTRKISLNERTVQSENSIQRPAHSPGASNEPSKQTLNAPGDDNGVATQFLQQGEIAGTITSNPGPEIFNKHVIKTKALPGENFSLATAAGKSKKRSKFDYTVYITPSASYRSLKEDRTTMVKQSSNVGGPVAINYISDVNQVVRHKPGTGMEAGVSLGYNLTNKLKVKTGLQINARQYSIEAFLSTNDVATIAYLSGGGIDSLIGFSSYRTSSGYESTQLENRFYQVSVPVALEYEVAGNKNIQFKIAAGIQPTYMVSDNAFLISTDFKNYIESPEMSRRWNMNANIETFLSIKSGTYKWQFGPQFRYQLRPTSLDKYPIREYLMDYGIKIGVTKSLQ